MAAVCLAASGPAGRVICGGLTTTTACTLAQAVIFTTGIFVEDVFKVMVACTLPASRGGTVESVTRNSFAAVLVFTWAVKALLLLSGAQTSITSSILFTTRTSVLTGSWDSAGTLMAANCGFTSMAFQTVPLS